MNIKRLNEKLDMLNEYNNETPAQSASINKLEKFGFYVNSHDGDTVFMMKRNRGTTFYAEVETDGSVSGMSVDEFLKSRPKR